MLRWPDVLHDRMGKRLALEVITKTMFDIERLYGQNKAARSSGGLDVFREELELDIIVRHSALKE